MNPNRWIELLKRNARSAFCASPAPCLCPRRRCPFHASCSVHPLATALCLLPHLRRRGGEISSIDQKVRRLLRRTDNSSELPCPALGRVWPQEHPRYPPLASAHKRLRCCIHARATTTAITLPLPFHDTCISVLFAYHHARLIRPHHPLTTGRRFRERTRGITAVISPPPTFYLLSDAAS